MKKFKNEKMNELVKEFDDERKAYIDYINKYDILEDNAFSRAELKYILIDIIKITDDSKLYNLILSRHDHLNLIDKSGALNLYKVIIKNAPYPYNLLFAINGYLCNMYVDNNGLDAALLTISEREKIILELEFINEMPILDIAYMAGISRSRVDQIRAKALRKLRHPSRLRKFYKDFNIDSIGLPDELVSVLRNANINTVDEMLSKLNNDITKPAKDIPGFTVSMLNKLYCNKFFVRENIKYSVNSYMRNTIKEYQQFGNMEVCKKDNTLNEEELNYIRTLININVDRPYNINKHDLKLDSKKILMDLVQKHGSDIVMKEYERIYNELKTAGILKCLTGSSDGGTERLDNIIDIKRNHLKEIGKTYLDILKEYNDIIFNQAEQLIENVSTAQVSEDIPVEDLINSLDRVSQDIDSRISYLQSRLVHYK